MPHGFEGKELKVACIKHTTFSQRSSSRQIEKKRGKRKKEGREKETLSVSPDSALLIVEKRAGFKKKIESFSALALLRSPFPLRLSVPASLGLGGGDVSLTADLARRGSNVTSKSCSSIL